MSDVHLIRVPYDSGQRALRMGAGPDALAPAVVDALRAAGHEVTGEMVEAPAGFCTEVTTGFALARSLSDRVRAARAAGRQPIALAGNCLTALGTVAGLRDGGGDDGDDDLAVVWFDAHGDLETPETTTSGFADGMALAALAGQCWTTLAASVPGLRPVRGDRVVLVGARDVSDAERDAIARLGVTWVRADAIDVALGPALDALAERGARRAYVHMDLDVHDPAEAPVNSYPAPGGPAAAAVRDALRRIGARLDIVAANVTAYDPSGDGEGRALAIARELAPLLVGR